MMISTCLTHLTVPGQSMSRNTVDIETMLQVTCDQYTMLPIFLHALCVRTVKGVNFFGQASEYVVSGSDCGNVFLWDKSSQEIVQCVEGDKEGVVSL